MVRISGASKPLTLPAADEMAFGIVVAESNGDITGLLLEGAMRTLKEAGCLEHNIHLKSVPSLMSLAMATQFFAEYTEVDAVILLGCSLRGERSTAQLAALNQNVLQIQLQWNMPCAWGIIEAEEATGAYAQSDQGILAAAEAVRMVRMQIDMEAASPNANPDRRNLN